MYVWCTCKVQTSLCPFKYPMHFILIAWDKIHWAHINILQREGEGEGRERKKEREGGREGEEEREGAEEGRGRGRIFEQILISWVMQGSLACNAKSSAPVIIMWFSSLKSPWSLQKNSIFLPREDIVNIKQNEWQYFNENFWPPIFEKIGLVIIQIFYQLEYLHQTSCHSVSLQFCWIFKVFPGYVRLLRN